MADTSDESRPTLEDNSDKAEEAQDAPKEAAQEAQGEAQSEAPTDEPAQKGEKGAWYSKPGQFGTAAGDKIQGALNPVGQPMGKGMEAAAKPLGSLVDPLVGGVMRAGKMFEGEVKGGSDSSAAKADEALKPTGGKEQTGSNPLGLNE